MACGDACEGKWRGNWQMEWVASTLHTTSGHGVSSITTADAHASAASSRLKWRPRRFKWTRPFCWKPKSGFCACAITFQTRSTKGLKIGGAILPFPKYAILAWEGTILPFPVHLWGTTTYDTTHSNTITVTNLLNTVYCLQYKNVQHISLQCLPRDFSIFVKCECLNNSSQQTLF